MPGMVPSFLEMDCGCFLIQGGDQLVINVDFQFAKVAAGGVEQAERLTAEFQCDRRACLGRLHV